jgi:hypothetical protein
MASDRVSKKYRKLLMLDSEHQVFRMIESLDEQTTKEILRKLILNKLRNEISGFSACPLEHNHSIV